MHAQITLEERYAINVMRKQRYSIRAIAAELGRAPSTVSRELRRNLRPSGRYVPGIAHSYAVARRRRSRRNARIGPETWEVVDRYLRMDWSPEQVAGFLKAEAILRISHETIYIHVWADKRAGGDLWQHLRQSRKRCRKRYRSRDWRGRLAGKRHISERPPEVEERREVGHWEIDTVMGTEHGRNSVVTMVERATGYLVMGKLARHCAADTVARCVELIGHQSGRVATITSDNGTEFHSYKQIEEATGAEFYFATPHHAWERGTNENTNGLVRQYLPKRTSFADVPAKLNSRPRKRLSYRTPEECYARS
ncbi:MAG: IS30 family transposase [Coriobacteriia bacterium]|nr:IS30 family transposase [Coriobacteriia bacterium]